VNKYYNNPTYERMLKRKQKLAKQIRILEKWARQTKNEQNLALIKNLIQECENCLKGVNI
jgi:hypothetical protein